MAKQPILLTNTKDMHYPLWFCFINSLDQVTLVIDQAGNYQLPDQKFIAEYSRNWVYRVRSDRTGTALPGDKHL